MINKKNLSEQIYEDIRNDILQQRIGFGEKLTNRGLQEKYGVSSTPVRDAINRLHMDGLLDDISNVGARVIIFDYQMAFEVNEVMSILSCEAIAMTAKRAPAGEVVALLEQNLQAQLDSVGNENYFKYDRQFHSVFPDFCGNRKIRQIFAMNGALWELLVAYYPIHKEASHTKALNEHKQILAAYRQGDIETARRWMKQHFDDAARPLSDMLNKNG